MILYYTILMGFVHQVSEDNDKFSSEQNPIGHLVMTNDIGNELLSFGWKTKWASFETLSESQNCRACSGDCQRLRKDKISTFRDTILVVPNGLSRKVLMLLPVHCKYDQKVKRSYILREKSSRVSFETLSESHNCPMLS